MRLFSVLRKFLLERGCILLDHSEVPLPEDLVSEEDLLLQDAKNVIVVKVIEGELDRSLFMKKALKAAALREYVDKVYIAIPSKFRLIVDGNVLLSNGIGLLIVNEEGEVQEALPAKPRMSRFRSLGKGVELDSITRRIDSLEERVRNLESALPRISRLSEELEELRREISLLRREVRSLSSAKVTRPEVPAKVEELPGEELPSYLRDNPWLEILSRRARESQN